MYNLVVVDKAKAQDSTEAGEELEDPVRPYPHLTGKGAEQGRVRRENQDGFCHEEGERQAHEERVPGKQSCSRLRHATYVNSESEGGKVSGGPRYESQGAVQPGVRV